MLRLARVAVLCVPLMAGPLHAQHEIRVRWPLMDVLVRGDTGAPIEVFVSPNVRSKQGAADTEQLEWLQLHPIEVLQWAQLMSQHIDTLPNRDRIARPKIIHPMLPTRDRGHVLALGVDSEERPWRRFFLWKSDSAQDNALQAHASPSEIKDLVGALRHMAAWVVRPLVVPAPPRAPCPLDRSTPGAHDASFRRPAMLTYPRVRYPDSERVHGREGRVWLQFMIDSSGAVVPGSECVLLTDGPGFTSAARLAVAGATFRPAERSGSRVAALVCQEFRFMLRR